MQRSEGGGLGIGGGGGGGGGMGGMMTGRGVAGGLVRATIIFGAIFFVTSLGLNRLTTQNAGTSGSQLEQNINEGAVEQQEGVEEDLGISADDVLFPSDNAPSGDDPQ
jgi:preprotein translocase subunit SecG